jgi:hypothetical protein
MATPRRYRAHDEDSARWLGFPYRDDDIVISPPVQDRHDVGSDDLRAADLPATTAPGPDRAAIALV